MTSIAGLPMYDWPEVADSVDELWDHIAEEARQRGIDVPRQLSRDLDLVSLWSDPTMILGQVCSLNPVRDGLGETEVIGTIVYDPPPGLPAMEPGSYASVIVCRADDDRRPSDQLGLGVGDATDAILEFGGARLAANGTDSQSGYWSLGHFVRDRVTDDPIFGAVDFTGAHRDSMLAVANGSADLAAIDVHSWYLGVEHDPSTTDRLAVVGMTDPTPGVVCVVSWELARHRDALDAALHAAIRSFVATPAARNIHVSGYRRRHLDEFQVLADRVETSSHRPWHR